MNKPAFICTVLLCIAALRCARNDVAGPSTETGNPSLVAFVKDSAGTPVAGVSARVFRVEYEYVPPDTTPHQRLYLQDSRLTDNAGLLKVYGLSRGTYTVEVSDAPAAAAAFMSGIAFDSATVSDTIVMKPTGSIAGTVARNSVLYPQYTNRFIEVRIFGTSRVAVTDSTGAYRFDGIPEGCHTLTYYASDGFLSSAKDSVCVAARATTTVAPVTLWLSSDGAPPAPYITGASYDSASHTVYISWREVRVSDIFGYEVARCDSMRTILTISPVIRAAVATDNHWFDTVSTLPPGARLYYVVRSVDQAANRSPFNGPIGPITIP